MPKKNQIHGYAEQALSGGRIGYYWKPSPRERREGHATITFGTGDEGRRKALIGCIEQNERVAAARGTPGAEAPATRARILRPRWADLVRAYKADPAWRDRSAKTRELYDSSLRVLTLWADEGTLPLDQLTRQIVLDLRKVLVADPRKARTAALLRMLSILLQFAEDSGLIASSPARKLKIPAAPKRTRRIRRDHLPWLLHAADALDFPHVALGITLGFYSMQREGDLLAATGFQIRPVDDVSSDALRALGGGDGRVSGLWLQQQKTAEWVAVSLAPEARAMVEAAIAASRDRQAACTNLILCRREDRPCPEWRFQRDFRAVVTLATTLATDRQEHGVAKLLAGDSARHETPIQFRDLRRSGMCWLRELHVPVPLIASISGHSIEETQKILDTYMPRDTRAAAEGMAIAVARQSARDAEAAAEAAEQGGQG